MFEEYPKAIYKTIDEYIVVDNKEQEDEAISDGYKLHDDLFEEDTPKAKRGRPRNE